MGTVVELAPLFGFKSCYVADVNDEGGVVGCSSEPVSPFAQCYSRATLWTRDTNFTPVPLSQSTDRSEALRINEKGEVLVVEYDGPLVTDSTPARYWLWTEGQPPVDLAARFPGLRYAQDLNDNTNGNTQVLGELDSGQRFVGNPDGTLFPIPDVVLPDNATARPTLFGLDNSGRVGGWLGVHNPVPLPLGPALPVHWLRPDAPAPGNNWSVTPVSCFNTPRLTKGGVILFQIEEPDVVSGVSHWYDLDHLETTPGRIPFVGPEVLHYYTDANEAGWIVGHEDWDEPTLHNLKTGITEYLRFDEHSGPDPYKASAHAVNSEGDIIGNGRIDGRMRGWILSGFVPARPSRPKVAVLAAASADPLYVMLGGSRYEQLVELRYPHTPFEAFEGLADLMQLMSPAEKRRIQARIGLVRGYASALESQLERGGGGERI